MFFLTPKDGLDKFFMPYQIRYLLDTSHLVIVEKGRQIGLSYAASYRAVRLAATKAARLDVWVMSQDKTQATQFLLYCKRWARVLKYAAQDLGEVLLDADKDITAHVLKFANGICIYCLSSNPDAIVGKTGHVILDEFVLHKDQRQLYGLAKPVIQWGGTMTIISTHRGPQTVFNQIITDIKERGNKMGWSLHSISIQRAVEDGIVEKINAVTGRNESRADWLLRQRAECLDEEQWLQEHCCIPADESSAFITYEMITACEDDTAKKDFACVAASRQSAANFYVGFDVARTTDLSVIDVEEKVGDVFWERLRIELRGKTFAQQEFELYRLLALPQVKRCCIDSSGLGMHLAERAAARFGCKVEAVRFTGPVKEELAFPLRAAHEDRTLRYARDEQLRADLRGIKKETTASGNIRFAGEAKDSHCDRFWAKALALHAGNTKHLWGGGRGPILI
jgi:phage FluMu gp28-like protein